MTRHHCHLSWVFGAATRALHRFGGGLLLALLFAAPQAWAEGVIHDGLFDVFTEAQGQPEDLEQVRQHLARGDFRQVRRSDLTFGLGADPTWVHARVENPSRHALDYRLVAGATWMDRLDVYLLDEQDGQRHWRAGDDHAGAVGVVPGVGTTFVLSLPPGESHVFIRAETADPMVLPVDFVPVGETAQRDAHVNIAYGVLYGFLVALIAYNILFYIGLRRVPYLYYSLYVGCFILTNVAYTGQGFGSLWPDSPEFQRYIILVMMVSYSVIGLSFAASFLELSAGMPRALRLIRGYQLAGLLAISLSVVLQNQLGAAWVAFVYLTGMTLIMLTLGVLNVRRLEEGRYFLLAATVGMLGMLSTDLAVWSVIPFSDLSYHGAEIGIVSEAIVFAIALARQLRRREAARHQAEHLASHDPLTGLRNRRAFLEEGEREWHRAQRDGAELSVVMLDMDHFKRINDRFGHAVGDEVLVQLSVLVGRTLRNSDLVARWGGEEIVLLLPHTDLPQATYMAERLRAFIAATPIRLQGEDLFVTASLGVATLDDQASLEELIETADMMLLEAKQAGRNCIRAYQAEEKGVQPGLAG